MSAREPLSIIRTDAFPSPRTIATNLSEHFAKSAELSGHATNVREGREFLRSLSIEAWQSAVPDDATIIGQDYRAAWLKLSGEAD